jgi:signal transduction histidine kinase
MRHSVSWHFLLYSLAIILVAIVAVGAVTLVLVRANFSRQEQQYLLDRGDQILAPLQSALQAGSDPSDLQGIASLGLVTGHVRIRVLDGFGRVLADSGSYGDLFAAHASEPGTSPVAAYQVLLDASGHYRGIRMTAEPLAQFGQAAMPNRHMEPVGPLAFSAAMAPELPVADVSAAAVSLPIQVNNRIVGHAEISEGPAFGQVIVHTLQQALLFGGLAALAVAAIAAVVAARQVTRPLLSLGDAADEMAQGNLSARAPGSKLAEMDRLATQFNSMADQLSSTIGALESERASLRRFIADASHELRTPLTALKTFNSLLAGRVASDAERSAELIQESGRQLDHLDHLTSDLLDLSRLEAGLNGAKLAPEDVRPVIDEAVSALRQSSQAKAQSLEMSLPAGAVIVAHDPAMLLRAIQNLVANAVKFTPEGGHIKVTLAAGETKAFIHVEDDGPGIPAAERAHVFDRFYRGRSVSGEGSGLGLAIAREIAAIHHASIAFTGEEGGGSRFTLELPLASG